MASIVLGMGVSHTPLLALTVDQWQRRSEVDYANTGLNHSDGRLVTYAQLLAEVGPRYADEVNFETFAQKSKACDQSLDHLGDVLAQVAPDVVVIVGDDQRELFTSANQPAMAIYHGERFVTSNKYGHPDSPEWIQQMGRGYLMDDLHNQIRNTIKDFCVKNDYPFFNARSQDGFMRNMILRNTSLNDWMLILIFKENQEDRINALMEYLKETFPQITSLLYVVNGKQNDTIYDLDVQVFAGKPFMVEQLEDLKFNIQPKSFFQTNTEQTFNLYNEARKMANIQSHETVYDLYTGVGSIANFVAKQALTVVGIESVEQAIIDAKENSAINQITNTHFYAGDMKDVLNDELIAKHGKPDVIITDPPRAGMHPDVIEKILELRAPRIVYVSCNPASQARDIAMMQEHYQVTKVQAVDMFPHTHHVECVALLELI
jgi:23S rRNA (uracil1939-C5)-methyltransferase